MLLTALVLSTGAVVELDQRVDDEGNEQFDELDQLGMAVIGLHLRVDVPGEDRLPLNLLAGANHCCS